MAGETPPKALHDYFTLQRGTTYMSRLLEKPGPVLLGLASIQRNGGFRSGSLRTYGGDSPKKLLVQPGELYVSLKDVTQSADLLGAVARLPIGYSPGRLTQDTVKLVPKHDDISIDYIYCLLRTPQYRNYCRAHATGTTNLGLPRDDFLAFAVPELTAIRQRIINIILALDDKIELNRRMNETLEAMARALFKDWFVDFGPTRAKIEGRDPYLAPKIWDLFPDKLDEDGKPEGWEFGCLADIADSPSRGVRPSEVSEDTPYIGLEHMSRHSVALTEWGEAGTVTSNKNVSPKRGEFHLASSPRRIFTRLCPRRAPIGYGYLLNSNRSYRGAIALVGSAADVSLHVLDDYENLYHHDIHWNGCHRTNWKTMGQFRIVPVNDAEEALTAFEGTIGLLTTRIVSNIHECKAAFPKPRSTLAQAHVRRNPRR